MREWIKVEDGLPETDDKVWVTADVGGEHNLVFKTWYSHDDNCWNYKPWDEFDKGIIAWMPIVEDPKPYYRSSVSSKEYLTSDDTEEEIVKKLIGKIHRENGKCDSVELADDFINNSDSLDDTWKLSQILNMIHINSYKEW